MQENGWGPPRVEHQRTILRDLQPQAQTIPFPFFSLLDTSGFNDTPERQYPSPWLRGPPNILDIKRPLSPPAPPTPSPLSLPLFIAFTLVQTSPSFIYEYSELCHPYRDTLNSNL